MGAPGNAPFVFDNEKWSHRVEVEPFQLRRPLSVTSNLQPSSTMVVISGKSFGMNGAGLGVLLARPNPVYWERDGEGGWDS